MSTENVSQETKLATTKAPVSFGRAGVELATLEDAYRFATAVSKSGFAPKGMDSVESILIAVQFGAELGLTPMASLQSLAIVNGRPSIFGDAALALVRGSGFLESYSQKLHGEGDAQKAVVAVKRKGEDAIVAEFSVADAKKAGLWGKPGPWTQYPTRMLMWRARGFALRDAFGDVLRGLATFEEVQDLPPAGFDHAKQVNEPVKPAFEKKKAKTPEVLPADAAPVSQVAASPEPASTPAAPVDAPKADAAAETKPAPEPPAAEPEKTAPVDTFLAPDRNQDPGAPLLKRIRDAMLTYDISEDAVLAWAKEQAFFSKRSQLRLDDLSDNILGLMVNGLDGLIKPYSEGAK